MKKKVLPVLIVIALIILVLGIAVISKLIEKYTPSKEHISLSEQYAISSDEESAIILNQQLIDTKALIMNDQVYVDYDFAHDYLNARFYWDSNENLLLYTTAEDLITVEAESSSYLVSKNNQDFGSTIVKVTTDATYINLAFIQQYTDMIFNSYTDQDCSRVVIYTSDGYGDMTTCTLKKNAALRIKGGIKSPILYDLCSGDAVYILDDYDDWKAVMTTDGILGYVQTKFLGSESTTSISSDFEEETFSHISRDSDIELLWHQVTNASANSNVSAVLSSTKGLNVISPTWFYLNDNDGNIYNLGSTAYVTYCHQQGVEVWALVSNLENSDVDTTYVLTHTSTRQNLVNQIVSVAIQYDLDGINIDFEAMDAEGVGDSFIQFIRELSLKLHKNDIVLSVDNYVPTDYTSFYNRSEQAAFADYVIIMAYDEHYSGSEAGSVASSSWVEEGVTNTLKEVPANQVILAMPFYNRIWTVSPASEDGDSEEYVTDSYSVGMDDAINMLNLHDVSLTWLDDCGQYYGEYTEDSTTYKIWLENVDSLTTKLDIMAENNLAGGAFWKAGLESSEVWNTIIKYID